MALADSSKDLEPGLPSDHAANEKGQQSLYLHPQSCSRSVNSSRRSSCQRWARDRMPSFRRLTLAVFIIAFLTMAYASAPVYRRPQDSRGAAKEVSFQDLLNSVSDASLHDVLINVYEKYRHGIFPEDRTAMKAVHDDDASVATSLVELARRQNPNVTSVTTVPASSTAVVVVVPTTETNTVVQTSGGDTIVVVNTQTTVVPIQTPPPANTPVPTTAPPVSSIPPPEPSSSAPAPAPVQSSVPVQSVNSSPPPGSFAPAPVSSPASSQANPSTQANPTSQASPSSSQAPAQSSANSASGGGGGGGSGSAAGKTSVPATAAPSFSGTTLTKTSSPTITSTYLGQAGASTSAGAGATTATSSSTQQIIYTTTRPDGSQSTVTSFTIIPAGEQASTPGVSGSAVTGMPSLQNGAVAGSQLREMGLVGSLAAGLILVVEIL